MDNKINNMRIKVANEEDKKRVIKALSVVFNIVKCSDMFKINRNKTEIKENIHKGYYIYLEVEEKINNRGAGRKERFTEQQKTMIKMYRYQGKTIREIANLFECSVGTIHKILKEED